MRQDVDLSSPTKRRVRVLLLAIAFVFIQAAHFGIKAYRVHLEQQTLMTLHDRFLPSVVDKTCPETQFKTRLACLREIGKQEIFQKRDTFGTLLLLSIGTWNAQLDKTRGKCASQDCALNLIEYLLDVEQSSVEYGEPSRFSPFLEDHIERAIQAYSISTMLLGFDAWERKTREPKNQTDLDKKRIENLTARYKALRPLLEDQTKLDVVSSMIFRKLGPSPNTLPDKQH